MQPDPPMLKSAGDLVFPDVAHPWPFQLAAIAALAWVFLAPIWLGSAIRRGRGKREAAIYAFGVIVTTAFFTFESGMMGEGVGHRLGVWARNIWLPLLGIGFLLGGLAAVVGRIQARRGQGRDGAAQDDGGSPYRIIDETIYHWAEKVGSPVFTEWAGAPARFFYLGGAPPHDCFQISVDPPRRGIVDIYTRSVDTNDGREFEDAWSGPTDMADALMGKAVAQIESWMRRE